MEQKRLSILLSLGLDKSALQDAEKQFAKYDAALAALVAEAKDLEAAIKKAAAAGSDTKKLTAELEKTNAAIAQVKRQSSTALASGFVTAKDKAAEMRREIEQSGRDAQMLAMQMRDVGRKMAMVGGMVRGIGASISTPIMGAMTAYLQNGSGETQTRWKAAQEDIQKSYQRIGAVAAEELLPAIEAAGKLVENLADFVEKNPELIKAALVVAGGLQVVGTGLQFAGAAKMLTGAARIWGGGKLLAGAGTVAKAAGGFVAGAGGAALGGVGLGLAGYNALANSQIGQRAGLANLGQYASVAAYKAGSLFGEKTANDWFRAMGEMTGVIEKQTKAAKENVEAQPTDEQLKLYAEAREASDERLKKERENEAERTKTVAEQGAARVKMEEDFSVQRAKTIRDFAASQIQAEREYNANRAKTLRDYNRETVRLERAHKREMRQLEQSHQQRLKNLIAARDALGIADENAAYQSEKQQKNADYRDQMNQRAEQLSISLADNAAAFEAQRAQRQADFDARLVEMDAQHQAEMEKNRQQADDALAALDQRNAREIEQLRSAEQNRWRILNDLAVRGLSQVQAETIRNSERYLADYRRWLGGQHVLSGGRASGGYIDRPGTYQMAEGGSEFVLSASSTSAAERVMGGRLNQGDIISRLAGRGGSTINLQLPGGLVTMPQLNEILSQRFDEFGAALSGALGGLA